MFMPTTASSLPWSVFVVHGILPGDDAPAAAAVAAGADAGRRRRHGKLGRVQKNHASATRSKRWIPFPG